MSDPAAPLPVVAVFLGGASREHDISLRSGTAVVRALPAAGFVPLPVLVTRDGRFAFPPVDDPTRSDGPVTLSQAVAHLETCRPVCAFIAMHGLSGEDGRVQALCDWLHVPHIGADVIGSAVALDKWFSKSVYRASGIPTPDAVLLHAADRVAPGWVRDVVSRIGLPFVVKASREGSSYGVAIVRESSEVESAVGSCAGRDGRVIIEAYRSGREFSVPVLEDPTSGEPRALPVIEIVVKSHEFFDLASKYDPTLSEEICPAPIPGDLAAEIQRLGVAAHRALALSGFSRTDVIVDDGGAWVLETNTIPGMTQTSLFPKAAAVAGIPFPEMVRTLVQRAIGASRFQSN
jgi:D-alanine-D-alanine ligase